jgi:ubiquinone/menaquinone biosynthesis C-methylase UbiE
MNRIDQLAALQKKYMDEAMFLENRAKVHETWFDVTTTDYWRQKRMYETVAPFARAFKTASWLTVGDGRYALDAIRLKKIYGLSYIFPTDIGENMLRISKAKGYINEYGIENAEQLTFMDDRYDVVFCKEAFHHFSRPYLALYEMIRVCKTAVVMIEPAERVIVNGVKSGPFILSAIKLFLSKLTGRTYRAYAPEICQLNHTFEEAGNYLYSVSVRELEKLAHGLGLSGFAYKGFNDVYVAGCEFEKAIPGNPIFDKISNDIAQGDELCLKYPAYQQPNMVSVILFKEPPAPDLQHELTVAGYTLPNIQKNPFI